MTINLDGWFDADQSGIEQKLHMTGLGMTMHSLRPGVDALTCFIKNGMPFKDLIVVNDASLLNCQALTIHTTFLFEAKFKCSPFSAGI